MKEYKLNLECENLKKKSGNNEYDNAIQLLNETLGKLQLIDPEMVINLKYYSQEIDDELSDLLQ